MYRTVSQLDAAVSTLAATYPQLCSQFVLPEPSVQGRQVNALRLRAGAGGENRRGVLLVGGTHARELMNPDLLIEMAVDLVASYLSGNDVILNGRTWPAADVRLILETIDLYLLPCVNPDGRQYVMTVDGLWRKNRRDNQGTACDGVDLNRNVDLLWGVTEGADVLRSVRRHLLRAVRLFGARDPQRPAPPRCARYRLLCRCAFLLGTRAAPLGARAHPDR